MVYILLKNEYLIAGDCGQSSSEWKEIRLNDIFIFFIYLLYMIKSKRVLRITIINIRFWYVLELSFYLIIYRTRLSLNVKI